jgi:hypothetical protein
MSTATTRRAALGAIIAAVAATVPALPAAASKAIAALEPYEDAALLALLTEARALNVLQNEIDDAEDAVWRGAIFPDRPSVLNLRPDDHLLVRSRRAEYDEPDIRELRRLVEGIEELGRTKMADQASVSQIKTRGREIIDAWDSYQAECDGAEEAVGLPAINRQLDEFNERRRRLWSRIAQTPARTVEGKHAKIAFASSFNLLAREDLAGATVEDLLLSAAVDYADLHGAEART